MFVYYKSDGKIVDVSEVELKNINKMVELKHKNIPEDFFATFPLGKYLIKNKKLKSIKGFTEPPKALGKELLSNLFDKEEFQEIFDTTKPRVKKQHEKKATRKKAR